MKFSVSALFALITLASALAIEERAASGACCIAEKSKKQDACNVGGAAGKCVPADSAGCGAALTCIANAQLTCNAKVLENGKPLCRPKA